jgi:trk system potassium uptake protein TrkH
LLNIVALHLEGMDLFNAINHAFATVSTGGFSTKNASMGYYNNNSLIIWTTTVFMFISGINFLAHLRFFYDDVSGYESEETIWYFKIFVILSLALSLVHYSSSKDSLYFSLTHGFFTVSSILTTTGFVSVNYAKWGQFAIAIVFIAMLIGGNTGSTAGGIKVVRYIVLFKSLGVEIKKILYPNAIFNIFLNGFKVKPNVLNAIVGFFFTFCHFKYFFNIVSLCQRL